MLQWILDRSPWWEVWSGTTARLRFLIPTIHEKKNMALKDVDIQQQKYDFARVKKTIHELLQECKVAAVSVGVFHQGKVLLSRGYGTLDPRRRHAPKPDDETLYTLCSISKTFVTASLGILVEEGKLSWEDPVGKYLDDFHPTGDVRVAKEATFNDFLRHSGGLSNPVVSILGPQGKVLVPQKDFINLVNDTPISVDGEANFQRWVYSNIAYGLMALVIEKLSGQSYAEFLRERILKPLGMRHTAVLEQQIVQSSNIAHGYAKLEDGSWHPLRHGWTSENNSPVLAMVGMRSSVWDMMIFAAAVLQAYCYDQDKNQFDMLPTDKPNPLKQMGAILNGYYWTRPHTDPFGNEAAYHLAWLRTSMPTCMTSWGSWNSTLGDMPTLEKDVFFRNENILGKRSPPRLMFKSSGIGFCGTGSVNLFPATQSAVVVFCNGLNVGDLSDFVAMALIQALFKLEPPIDILQVAKYEVGLRKQEFKRTMDDLQAHRGNPSKAPPANVDEYIGQYHGLAIDLVVRPGSQPNTLQLCFNHQEDLVRKLEHYADDQFSYWPTTRDEWLRGGWLDWDYYLVGLLTFKRDQSGSINGLTWVWERDAEPHFFHKVPAGEILD